MRRKFSPFPPNTEGLSPETPMDTANSLHRRFAFLFFRQGLTLPPNPSAAALALQSQFV